MSGEAGDRLDRDFTISLRAEVPADRAGAAGGLASKFDPATRTGFNLSAISSAGGYNGPGDELRISFGIDAGSEPRWFDRGRPSPTSNYVSNSLTVFDGSLARRDLRRTRRGRPRPRLPASRRHRLGGPRARSGARARTASGR